MLILAKQCLFVLMGPVLLVGAIIASVFFRTIQEGARAMGDRFRAANWVVLALAYVTSCVCLYWIYKAI